MSCKRGKANPDQNTKLRLFADSGGYCQNPNCNTNLFQSTGKKDFHIAEMAHIISAGDRGPRSDSTLTKEQKGNYSNLILLCPNCHTTIDKAENDYPQTLIIKWKNEHTDNIKKIFNIKKYGTRREAREVIYPILLENRFIFETWGPLTDSRYNPESEIADKWKFKLLENILPNNRKILNIIESNFDLLKAEEISSYAAFKQHVNDLEARHITKKNINTSLFPTNFDNIFI